MSRAQQAQKSVQRLVATGALRLTSVPQNVVEQLTQFIFAELSNGVSLARAEAKVLELAKQLFKASKTNKGEKSRGEDDENAVDEEVEAEIFQNYACKSLEGVTFASGCIPTAHPGEIAESGLLASVPLPKLSYCTAALDGCASRNVLSDLQIEGCLHACQRHTALNSGVRAGFFLGDGAGVGKGRQIAAMILDNVARGRQKHIWFSISSDLRLDAERDLCDVGCHIDIIDGCQSLDSSAKLAFGSKQSKRGVLFSTYSTLISALSFKGSNRKARLDQVVEWCGGSMFDGLLVFDESHKSKNFDVKKAENSTKMSQAVIAIQEQLPLARVVYASATGVTEITNLAYASRLGLFGPGTSFENFLIFSETMEKRGVGALEMLALELKASGAYVSRGLSWSRCEFEHVICCLPDDDVATYDALAQWWRALRQALDYALGVIEYLGVKGNRGLTWQRFWGTQLRFFKEVQTALKVPFVIDVATRALGEGSVVVIGLQSTGEAGLDSAMAKARLRPGDAVPGGLVAGAKVAARKFVEDFFPVGVVPEDANDAQSNDSTNAPLDDDMAARLLQIENQAPPTADQVSRFKEFTNQSNSIAERKREAMQASLAEPIHELVQLKEEALRQLDELTVPASPLDTLIDALGGTAAVAEMTGRASRIARKDSTIGPLRYEQRLDNSKAGSSCDSLNVRERRAFMDGKKSIAIISDAASTGVSLHAANGTPAAHKRRVHITLELAWSADKTIQQLGRSHRANQASAPKYKLVTTDLAGENRFAAAVAKRLSSLGALTKGDRRAASGQDMADFDVDNKHGRTALGKMAAACKNRFENAMAPSVSLSANSNEPLRKALTFARAAAIAPPSSAVWAECLDLSKQQSFKDMFERAALILASPAKGGEPYFDVVSSDNVILAVLARRAYAHLEIDPKKENDVRTFLNRLQALDVVAQKLLFEYFCACLRSELAEAKRNGTLDTGVADVRAASAIVDRADVVSTDPLSGATTTLSEILLDRGVSFDGAVAKHDDAIRSDFENENDDQLAHLLFTRLAQQSADDHDISEKAAGMLASVESYHSDGADKPLLNPARRRWETGFYISQRPLPSTQKHGVLLAVRRKGSANFVVTRPNTGTSPYEMALIDLQQRYRPMSIETTEGRERLCAKWATDYTEAEHEGKGARVYKVGLVSGAVLPFWKALEKTVVENKSEMTRAEQALKVCRICLDDGRKLVGIRFPYAVLSALRANMDAEKVAKGVALCTMKIEEPTPIDVKALVAASTKPRTLYNYFAATSSSKEARKASPTALKRTTEGPSTAMIKKAKHISSKPQLKGNISTFFVSTNPAEKQGLTRRDRLQRSTANAECPICRAIVDVDAMNEHLDSSCLGSN